MCTWVKYNKVSILPVKQVFHPLATRLHYFQSTSFSLWLLFFHINLYLALWVCWSISGYHIVFHTWRLMLAKHLHFKSTFIMVCILRVLVRKLRWKNLKFLLNFLKLFYVKCDLNIMTQYSFNTVFPIGVSTAAVLCCIQFLFFPEYLSRLNTFVVLVFKFTLLMKYQWEICRYLSVNFKPIGIYTLLHLINDFFLFLVNCQLYFLSPFSLVIFFTLVIKVTRTHINASYFANIHAFPFKATMSNERF